MLPRLLLVVAVAGVTPAAADPNDQAVPEVRVIGVGWAKALIAPCALIVKAATDANLIGRGDAEAAALPEGAALKREHQIVREIVDRCRGIKK